MGEGNQFTATAIAVFGKPGSTGSSTGVGQERLWSSSAPGTCRYSGGGAPGRWGMGRVGRGGDMLPWMEGKGVGRKDCLLFEGLIKRPRLLLPGHDLFALWGGGGAGRERVQHPVCQSLFLHPLHKILDLPFVTKYVFWRALDLCAPWYIFFGSWFFVVFFGFFYSSVAGEVSLEAATGLGNQKHMEVMLFCLYFVDRDSWPC